MIFKLIYMFFVGFVKVTVEGFFVERFINSCKNKGIILQNIKIENGTMLKGIVLKDDFKKLKSIARKTKCRVHINKKIGIPFILNRYRKRKIFGVAVVILAILIFTITRYVWNIEIIGNEKIKSDEILNLLNENSIHVGVLKSKINDKELINNIILSRDDISWVGVKIKGTNLIIEIAESIEKPEIFDETKIANIVADRKCVISKIVVQNGTARVNIGDEVNEGDLLVEGVMEGKYTGSRSVHAKADVWGKSSFETSKEENFFQENLIETGRTENKLGIIINNFSINFYKTLSNFEIYDTIGTRKKVKIFSDFYLPFEIVKNENIELVKEEKNYSLDELVNKITLELEEELNEILKEEYCKNEEDFLNFYENYVEEEVSFEETASGVILKLKYVVNQPVGIEYFL